MDRTAAFQRVVDKIGSQQRLADKIGRKQSTVSHWKFTGIPAEAAVELERATDGEIPRWMARPDLWEAPQDGSAQ
jgi:DNA-binding transcriptional regulator YdaS (Cro superfamily)